MEVMVSDDLRSQVHTALRALAEHSSDAPSADHAGFHRLDVTFGCELAETERLDLVEVVVGAHLLRRYRQQLEALGIALPDEAAITNWAIAQEEETIGAEEIAIATELADVLDVPPIFPPAEPPQSDASKGENGQAEKSEKKQTVVKRVYVQDNRLFVEFPFDRAKVNAMQPLKELVEDWAFNRYKRQEWSFPVDAASTVYQVTRGFSGFVYTLDAVQHIKRTSRKECRLTHIFAKRGRYASEEQKGEDMRQYFCFLII